MHACRPLLEWRQRISHVLAGVYQDRLPHRATCSMHNAYGMAARCQFFCWATTTSMMHPWVTLITSVKWLDTARAQYLLNPWACIWVRVPGLGEPPNPFLTPGTARWAGLDLAELTLPYKRERNTDLAAQRDILDFLLLLFLILLIGVCSVGPRFCAWDCSRSSHTVLERGRAIIGSSIYCITRDNFKYV